MKLKAKHLKTGNIYEIVNEEIINATNANDGEIMVLYKGKLKDKDEMGLFAREKKEFYEKFEVIKEE